MVVDNDHMPLYPYECKCGNKFDRLASFNAVKAVGEPDQEVVCPNCSKAGAVRAMSTGITGGTTPEPWEYDYTHDLKPKYVKDSKGNRHKFNPAKHTSGRKGLG